MTIESAEHDFRKLFILVLICSEHCNLRRQRRAGEEIIWMSRGFNSAIPSSAAAAMFSHSQSVSSAMSNASISKVYYKRQLFWKHKYRDDIILKSRIRLIGLVFNSQIKMRVNVRYCTCACVRDTGTVLKRLSGASDLVIIQTRRKRLCMRRREQHCCLHQSRRMLEFGLLSQRNTHLE